MNLNLFKVFFKKLNFFKKSKKLQFIPLPTKLEKNLMIATYYLYKYKKFKKVLNHLKKYYKFY